MLLLKIIDNFLNSVSDNPWEVLSGIASVVISLITLNIAIKVKKEFAINHLRSKQIDHVCNIIEFLNKQSIEVLFASIMKGGGSGGSGSILKFNIFELGRYEVIDNSDLNPAYDNEVVLFKNGSNQILDIKKYIDHPLIPRPIADELNRFHNNMGFPVVRANPENENLKYVEIKTDIWHENIVLAKVEEGDLIESQNEIFSTWLNLKSSSSSLKKVIGVWFMENGIKETNIREDFKS